MKTYYAGLQANLSKINISNNIIQKLEQLTNNLGDCYGEHTCPTPNSMMQERLAVEKVAQWLELSAEECWGYIGGSSTLGNLQGMWMGATLMTEATCVFTDTAHYSIPKFANTLRFKHTKIIKTHRNGEIDLEDFKKQINPQEPVVLILTSGTTMTSAYDPIDACTSILKQKQSPFYLHLDAALGGLIIPFLSEQQFPPKHQYTFQNPDISSITVSAHKVLGMPMPANIFMARQHVVKAFKSIVNKVQLLNNLEDITIYSSRDGFRACVLFEQLQQRTFEDVQQSVQTGLKLAQYTTQKLQQIGFKQTFTVTGGLATVICRKEYEQRLSAHNAQAIIQKYNLVQDQTYIHIYMMEHIDQALCDHILKDIYEQSQE